MDDCHFSYITKLQKKNKHTAHLWWWWWWLLLLLLLVGFRKFWKAFNSKDIPLLDTLLYISSWETMPLGLWPLTFGRRWRKKKPDSGPTQKYENFCMVLCVCVCVCVSIFYLFFFTYFTLLLLLTCFFFSIILLFLFQCFFYWWD